MITNRVNNRGTVSIPSLAQGPQGPTGPEGPPGPTIAYTASLTPPENTALPWFDYGTGVWSVYDEENEVWVASTATTIPNFTLDDNGDIILDDLGGLILFT